MFYYLSFLRPPPLSCWNGAVSITPQIANDLRTELFEGVQDIYYSWVSVATGEETKGTKLTTWRGQSSAYKELKVPLPRSATQGSAWRLVLGEARVRLEDTEGPTPLGVVSMPIVVGRAQGTKSDQIERVYTFGEKQRVRITEQTSFDLDKKIWDSGIGLSSWLVANPVKSTEPLTILELGTGTGMVSIVWGTLRPEDHIIATDVESAMPLLRHNIAVNGSSVEAAVLNWDDEQLPDTALGRVFDVVIMADVSYNTASFPSLVRTIKNVTNLGTRVLVGYKERDEGERTLWAMLEAIGIKLKLIGRRTGAGGMPVEIWENAILH